MAGQVSPGIVLRESDLTTQTIVTAQANSAALVGSFAKGPVGTIVDISNERELLETFGAPNNSNYEDWFVAQTFLSYGGQLKVVRVADTALKNAVDDTTATAVAIKSQDDFNANFSTYDWKFAARTAGTWANGLKIAVVDGGVSNYATATIYGSVLWSTIANDPGNADDLHIAVLDANNNILETFLYVSRLTTARDSQGAVTYFKTVINNTSKYIYAGPENPAAGESDVTLALGVDAYSTTVATITAAFDLFENTEETQVDFILCGGSLSTEADQVTKAQKAITIATTRKDAIAFVSPHNGLLSISSASGKRDDIITFFESVGTSNSYSVFDSGYKYIYDKYNDTYRYIPCCGDVAGLCVQVSATQEDWFSPAGLNRGNLKNVVKLAYSPSQPDRDKLYLKRINPISTFPGQGTVLFGDKTALSTPSAFDRINVRRLFLAIEKRIGQLAKTVMFELNDETTRTAFYSSANSYLSEVQAKRGLVDYLVVCDTSNNTPDVIDRNEFVAEIYIKPTRSINYITVTFVATRSGVEFSEVIRSNG
jgi:phage tail sheath protein FI